MTELPTRATSLPARPVVPEPTPTQWILGGGFGASLVLVALATVSTFIDAHTEIEVLSPATKWLWLGAVFAFVTTVAGVLFLKAFDK